MTNEQNAPAYEAVSHGAARKALDDMDDFARMANVDAIGARGLLERYIAQQAQQPAAGDAVVSIVEGSSLWISVNDRLPADDDYGTRYTDDDVIVRYRYTDDPRREWDVGTSRHDPDNKRNGGWGFGSCNYAEVSHWMRKDDLLTLLAAAPKPAAPREDAGLPPLPNASYAGIFTPEQMHAYAREAIALTHPGHKHAQEVE